MRDQGVFFPIDPGADASLGGMAATRASGTNAVRYGTMRENVLSLTAVMANGDVVRTARRARKSSGLRPDPASGRVGRNPRRHYRGGGEALRHPRIAHRGVCPFPSLEDASKAVIQTIQMGIPVARIELVDEEQVKVFNAYARLNLKIAPMLFVEFHGTPPRPGSNRKPSPRSLRSWAGDRSMGKQEEDRQRLWQARHDAFWAAKSVMPGKEALATDVCVPISALGTVRQGNQQDLAQYGLFGPIVGHAGDGNFHVTLFCDTTDEDEVARVKTFYERLIRRAIAMDGTSTGEHGIGRGKMKFLEEEHGAGVAVMREIKKALDPRNILNPGKIIAL